jgi:hypothetical protein
MQENMLPESSGFPERNNALIVRPERFPVPVKAKTL